MEDSKGSLQGIEALAFDVYGTLIDVAGVAAQLETEFGEGRGAALAARWREKQLEYSFRRGLMGRYVDFGTCTRQALTWVCAEARLDCGKETEDRLMGAFAGLPPYGDVAQALEEIRGAGRFRLCAFSNGTRAQVEDALSGGGIRESFDDIVSVDEVGNFKPAPEVYAHFLSRAGLDAAGRALMVSSNQFDAIGASAAGMKVAWINRGGLPREPWEYPPTVTLASLSELPAALG